MGQSNNLTIINMFLLIITEFVDDFDASSDIVLAKIHSTEKQARKGLIKFLVKEMNEELEVQEREVTEAEFVDLDDKALMQCFTLNSSNTGINGVTPVVESGSDSE